MWLSRVAEQRLAEQGYDPGPIDGTWDRDSSDALAAYSRDWRLRPTVGLDWLRLARLVRWHPATRPQWWPILGSDCSVWAETPAPGMTVLWGGGCLSGRATGHGMLLWNFRGGVIHREEVYEGEMQDGRRHGQGRMTWHHGQHYDGAWRDDRRQGRGVILWPNGDRYEGDWHQDRRQGQGKMTWANGDIYDGAWADDLPQGPGG